MAGSQRGIRAGRAYVELGVNDKIHAGLRAAQRRLQAFGAVLAGAGVAILTPMIGAAKVFADFGSELNDMAGRTGMAVEALAELGYAADMTGTDLAAVETGVRRMQKTLIAARDGSKEASEALVKLGISAAKIAALAPEQQFEAVARSLRAISDPTERAAVAMSVFGKGGTVLLPMIDDLDALRQKARELGLTMTTEQARAADELGDSYDTLKASVRGLALSVGSALAPALQQVTDALTRAVSSISRFVRQHQAAVVAAAKLALVLVGVGGALIGLGASLGIVASSLKVIPTIFGGIMTVLGSLLSPVGLAIAAIATLGTVLVVASGQGGEALRWLGEQFQSLTGIVSKSLGAIADALTAGDISLAAKVLWATLSLAWMEGSYGLQRVWMELAQGALKRLSEMKWAAVAFSNDMFRGMQQAANNAAYGILKAWNWLASSSKKVWADAAYAYQKLWIKAQAAVTGEDSRVTLDKLADLAESYLAHKGDVDREQKDRNAALAASYTKQRAEIQAKRRQEQVWIGKQSLAESAEFEAEVDKGLEEARGQLDRAKAEWRDATGLARGRAAQMPEGGAPESIASRVKQAMAGVGDALAALQSQKASTVGTFNVSAAYGLGQSSVQERTARAAEQTVRELKGIKAKVRQSATFA